MLNIDKIKACKKMSNNDLINCLKRIEKFLDASLNANDTFKGNRVSIKSNMLIQVRMWLFDLRYCIEREI